MQHGKRATYANHGCRCKLCTAAQSANVWARRQVKAWKAPLRVEGVQEAITDTPIFIPPSVIMRALERKEQSIKIEAMEILWHEAKKNGGDLAELTQP